MGYKQSKEQEPQQSGFPVNEDTEVKKKLHNRNTCHTRRRH